MNWESSAADEAANARILDALSGALVAGALHQAFWALAIMTVLSAGVFWRLRRQDGDSISRGRAVAKEAEPVAQ